MKMYFEFRLEKKYSMKLINSTEAGRILKRSDSCIRRLCGNEELKKELGAQKIGKTWILDQAKVEAYKKKLKGRKRRPKKIVI